MNNDYAIYVRRAKTGGYIAKLVRHVGDRQAVIHRIGAGLTIDIALRVLNFVGK